MTFKEKCHSLARSAYSEFFSYSSIRKAKITEIKAVIIYRIIQMIVIAYIIGYAFILSYVCYNTFF